MILRDKTASASRSRRQESHRFDEIPEAELEGDAVPLDRSYQAAQELGIVSIPCPLLQAALHRHPDHLPLGFSLHTCSVGFIYLQAARYADTLDQR